MAERLRSLAPDRTVAVSYMEFTDPRVLEAAQALAEAGHIAVRVVPAFLSPGGRHIKRDMPELVQTVAKQLPQLDIQLMPGALGTHERVIEALAQATLDAVDA